MEEAIIEKSYPLNFREEDAKNLGDQLRHRHSVEIIGMKRVGISNFLRFFLNHPEVEKTYINDSHKPLFIAVDLNDLVERELYPFWILTFKRLVDAIENSQISQSSKKEITNLFVESIQSRDLFFTIEHIRKAFKLIVAEGFYLTVFFLRFDRLKDIINEELFANLQGLIDATNHSLSYVFTSFRSLEMIAPHVFTKKELASFTHKMFIKPAKNADMKIIFETFEKRYHTTPSSDLLNKVIELSGGHVQYLQMLLVILSEKMKSESVDASNFMQIALSDERIMLQSEEIWESLTATEQTVLKKIVEGKDLSTEDKTEGKYLFDTGIAIQNGHSKTFSLLFNTYLMKMTTKTTDDGAEFSRNEHKLFKLLYENLNEVCEREKIIQAVWPEVEAMGVSDWTIDRLVARLRNKLKQQKSKYSIVTVKTRGYKLIEDK